MAQGSAIDVVRQFWSLMGTNDFRRVAAILADDYVLEWPQSGERVRGAERFAAINAEYPSAGPWKFDVDRIVGGDDEVVSDVRVTDGVLMARSVSFFRVANGRIQHQVEYWPEPYDAPPNRRHLVEPMD